MPGVPFYRWRCTHLPELSRICAEKLEGIKRSETSAGGSWHWAVEPPHAAVMDRPEMHDRARFCTETKKVGRPKCTIMHGFARK